MAKYVDREIFAAKVEQALLQMLTDPVFTIREEASASCLALSKSIYDDEWLTKVIDVKLEEFSRHERFMIRIQGVHFITRMQGEVPRDYANR